MREVPTPLFLEERMAGFGADPNDFALALYQQLRCQPGNVCCSPFSIRTALAMAQASARGETAAQMANVLGLSSTEDTFPALAAMLDRLHAAGGGRYALTIANSLWAQDGAPLRPEFQDRVTRAFGGALFPVDFRRAAEPAGATINQWVEDQTKGRITALIPAGALTADTRLVLVNAVYFKGRWVLPFDPTETRDEPFYLQDGSTVRAPLMHQQEEVGYLEAAGYQTVDLEYEGGDLSLLVLLPDRKDGFADLEAQLSVELLHDFVARLTVREVNLYLPRFKITWGGIGLGPVLAALGLTLPFDRDQADFSGINGCRPPHPDALFISGVLHKAFTEVNEEGTEAAAATEAHFALFGASPRHQVPVFRADHPFLFAIRDRESGTILFLGRLSVP